MDLQNKAIATADWLKESTIGFGSPFREDPIETVRSAVATRFPKALEKRDAILSVAAARRERIAQLIQQGHVQEPGLTTDRGSSSQPIFLERALAAGIDFLGRAEVALGLSTPYEGLDCRAFANRWAEESDEEKDESRTTIVPRPLQVHVQQVVTMRLSRFAAMRVAITCSREACTAFVGWFHGQDVRPILAKLCILGAQSELLKRSGPLISGHVARLAPIATSAVQKIFGDRVAAQAVGKLQRLLEAVIRIAPQEDADIAVPLAEEALDSEPECTVLQSDEGSVLHVPLQCSGSTDSAFLQVVQFHLVQRNGFLEFDNEDSARHLHNRRRSMSDSNLFIHGSGIHYSLPFDCVGQEAEIQSMSTDDALGENQIEERQSVARIDGCECSVGRNYGDGCISTPTNSELDVASFPELELVEQALEVETRVTVQLRNFPREFTREALVDLLDQKGFNQKYVFVYLPMDFTNGGCLGYADICMDTTASAVELQVSLAGHQIPHGTGLSFLDTGWSLRQNLDDLIERYRDSPVMHRSVPDENRPALFQNGQRVKFPVPKRPLRRPRIRKAKENP